MKQRHKFSLSYYRMVFFTVILLESIFFNGAAVKEISISTFCDLPNNDRIQGAIVAENRIIALEKSSGSAVKSGNNKALVFQPPHKKASWRFDFGLFGGKAQQRAEHQCVFTRLDDRRMIADLQSHGVEYRGKIESHWLTNLLSNWILPLAFLIPLGRFLTRRMNKSAAVMDVGRNKAPI